MKENEEGEEEATKESCLSAATSATVPPYGRKGHLAHDSTGGERPRRGTWDILCDDIQTSWGEFRTRIETVEA